MKKVGLGLLIGVGLMVAALGGFGQNADVFAQRMQPGIAPSGNGDLLVVPIPTADKGQLLAVVEPRQHVMSVYRIDAVTGKIALKSSRNLHYDLQMSDFNNEPPLPQEIRTLIEQR
jgi:hypothetical protein